MSDINSAGVGSPASRCRLYGPGDGDDDTPRWAWPVVARPSSRAVAQSSSQDVSTPSSTIASFFTLTPSASNVCERNPRTRKGSSMMRIFFANNYSPRQSLRKLVLRAIDAPLTAPTRWPTSDPATLGSNTTGTLQVSTLRGLARAAVRSPAVRPTLSGEARSDACGAEV